MTPLLNKVSGMVCVRNVGIILKEKGELVESSEADSLSQQFLHQLSLFSLSKTTSLNV